jgi:hypothetical protein
MPQPKNIYRVIFENGNCDLAHLMAVCSTQFGTNHRKDIMKNVVIRVIFVEAIISVMLLVVRHRNVDHCKVNASSESSRTEVITNHWAGSWPCANVMKASRFDRAWNMTNCDLQSCRPVKCRPCVGIWRSRERGR